MKAKTGKILCRLKRFYLTYRRHIWIGGLTSLLMIAIMSKPETDETRIIFKREGTLDFKDAQILGNPRQAVLDGEEMRFSKARRAVLDGQTALRAEIDSLKNEMKLLRSPSPLPSLAEGASAVYGPSSSPIPSVATVQVGTEKIAYSASAPEHAPIGLSQIGEKPIHRKLGSNLVSFPVKSTGKVFLRKPSIILPSGSYVKAKILTGVEAPEGKTYPVLLQLDFAYVIPNDKRLDLAGCFIIAKAQGDLSTERVQMQATKLSCVSKRGGMFEREINGFVADDADNSFAVIGRVNSKQDRVAAIAFLSSIVAGVGKAIQQAQTTNQTTPLGGSQSVITGDQSKYIAAGGAAEAATMVTHWYLKQAQNLLPTINIGSGQDVWIVMQDQVDLPKDYFGQNSKEGIKNVSIYSHFTRLLN